MMLAYVGFGIVMLGVAVSIVAVWRGARNLHDYRADALMHVAQGLLLVGGALCFVYVAVHGG